MRPTDQEYQSHRVFSELDQYIEFYKSLADSVFMFVSMGTKAIGNIDSYAFSSIQGTLTSIRTILCAGRINDAYALLRKYYDAAIITIYSNLYIEEHLSIENFVVQQIDNWLNGKDSLPEYRIMSEYIRKSQKVAPLTQLFLADDRYKRLRDRCNDHTHYNFYYNMLLNDSDIHLPNRGKVLDDFAGDLRDVVILHAAYLFVTKQHYMASSDYLDSLECGLTPEPDSQYWVAPFVQSIFDKVVAQHRPDIAAIIKDHTSMHLK
ncbi:hypothetical protein CVU37_06100 [candidate division BRC1 bacterium HGW-BRC1-1]|nr:MAG: hypothetical protein CVU37_06100 [candidate division BRC1 bacterium HGW-BRC1-1]